MGTKMVQRGMPAAGLKRFAVAAIGLSTAGVLLAQYRINTQINTGMQGTGLGSVRNTNMPFYRASTRSGQRHARFAESPIPRVVKPVLPASALGSGCYPAVKVSGTSGRLPTVCVLEPSVK